MKLFRKIYLRVFIGMLVLAVSLFSWLLWTSWKQSLESTVSYEAQHFEEDIRDFRRQMNSAETGKSTSRIRDGVASGLFRSVFGSSGALYRDGEEIFNVSSYLFDLEALKSRTDKNSDYSYISCITSPQRIQGKWMVLYLSDAEGSGLEGYDMVFYSDVTSLYTRIRRLLAESMGATVLLLAAVGFWLYRGIYRAVYPMEELKHAAASIAGGAYASRAPVRFGDEIGELTESFNRMAEQVENHMKELQRVNEQQRRLIGSLAHELKTPLTAMIGYADTLLTVELSRINQEKALNYILNEGKRLSGLSEKMLLLTGLYENGEKALEKRTVKVEDLLKRLSDLTVRLRQEKEVRLIWECGPEELKKEMDEDLAMSLFMNLVDNACKASNAQGEIRVRADGSQIMVEDDGRGIPAGEISKVTEAFYMVDKSRSRKAGGAGLGLALCRQIAELHGWRLAIESEEGRGCRVTVYW